MTTAKSWSPWARAAAIITLSASILVPIVTGGVTWMWKLEERQYQTQLVFASKTDLREAEARIKARLAEVEDRLTLEIRRTLALRERDGSGS